MANGKVVTLKQSDHEYWCLDIMVTNNPRYYEGKLCVDSPEEALKHIEAWLKKAWTSEPRWRQRKGAKCKISKSEQSTPSEKPLDLSPKSYKQRKEQWESATGSARGDT